MFWSKLNSGHGFTGWKQTKVQLILNTFWGNKSATISVFFFSFCRPVWFCLFVLINCDFFSSRWLKVSLSEPVSCRVSSGAATVVDHHRGDLSIDDLFLAIEIQHVDGWHLGGCAAGPSGAPWIGLVYQVCMWVLLQVQELTLPWAIVGPVALGCNDPVPSKLLKVNCEGVSTAACFGRFLITVEARFSARSIWAVEDFHFNEWLLDRNEEP